ncbi:secretin and TonB N terminus short domain protein [Bordetella holmesii 1058]|uniref:Secretin and TonB N terminus short domain protein n=1 Tax=Bordetella holmesii 1058 TaxID=1247648 RepID=A0ABN0S3N3_9BORD|nr:secretin and TonB N terminus short domain protein [Bordetella holmesii 1058]
MAPVTPPAASFSSVRSLRLARATALTALALALGLSVPALAQQTVPRSYQIEAAPLADALARYADQAGLTLLYEPSAVAGLKSPGLHGNYTPEQALARLLAGTPLVATRQGNGTYVVRPAGNVPQLPPSPSKARARAPIPPGTRSPRGPNWTPLWPTAGATSANGWTRA